MIITRGDEQAPNRQNLLVLRPALLMVALGLLVATGCGDRDEPESVPPQVDLRQVASELWSHRKVAISELDADRLSRVERGLALEADRSYYLMYLPHAAGQALADPPPDGRPTILARTDSSFVALVAETFGWPDGPRASWTLFRADRNGAVWRISFLTDSSDKLPYRAPGELDLEVSDEGLDLSRLADLRRHVAMHDQLPEEVVFAPGRFTTGLLDAAATHKNLEPWELTTTSTGEPANP